MATLTGSHFRLVLRICDKHAGSCSIVIHPLLSSVNFRAQFKSSPWPTPSAAPAIGRSVSEAPRYLFIFTRRPPSPECVSVQLDIWSQW